MERDSAARSRLDGGPAPAYEHATMNEALAAAGASKAGVTFVDLQERETRFAWADVYARAKRAAAALASEGVVRGDRVLISAPTCIEFLDAFFGTQLAGAIPVPIAPAARTQQAGKAYTARVIQLVSSLDARVILADEPSRELLDRNSFSSSGKLLPLEGLVERTEDTLVHEVGPDDIALLQLSSGSVGDPKPATILHRHLTQQCLMLEAGTPHMQPAVSWLPFYHDMGLTYLLLTSICKRHDLVLMRPEHFIQKPALWLRALGRHKGQFTAAPNFAYSMCLARVTDKEMEGIDLSHWRHAINGAEPINTSLFRKFGEKFAKWGLDPKTLRPAYGLAEATLCCTRNLAGVKSIGIDADHLAKTGEIIEGKRPICSVGVPYPGVTLEVRDENGDVIPERRVGRVWMLSPTNMTGYYRNEEVTARTLVNGWLDTGDLGFVADGEVYLVGRAKDIIIIRGGNHAPEEFEECLVGVPGVRPGAAVAVGYVPENTTGEELVLLVEAMPDVDEADLVKRIAGIVLDQTGINPHKVALIPRSSLPRTTSGKLRRREALRLFLTGQLGKEE